MGLDIPALRVLRETIRTYQECESYSDHGRATVFSYETGRNPRRELTFKTAFRRPDRLRFDVHAVADEDDFPAMALGARADDAVVCWRGAGFETWLDAEPAPVESMTLESVLAEVSDLPTAAAGYVAHLLLRNSADFAKEHRVRYHGVRSLETSKCHKVTIPTGTAGDRSNALTLWIDVESHLIRRLLEVHRTAQGRQLARPTQTILRFEPALDRGLDDELFRYDPPLPRSPQRRREPGGETPSSPDAPGAGGA